MEKLPFLMFKDHSSLEFGLLINSKGSYKGASRDVTYTSVPGRSGDLITDNGRYKNIDIKYKLTLLNTTQRAFTELTHQIKGWLLSEQGYFRLWDSYDDKYYRLGSYSDEVDIEQELRDLGEVDLAFNCKPFKYSFEGQKPVVFTAAGSLYNAEFYPSSPYIKITGSGTVTLTVNNDSFTFTDIDGYIEVDSDIMNAYKGTEPQNNKMTGSGFPTLLPGNNAISWVGDVEKLEIVPRWCCL
ncbi:phage tail family protein [Ruminococcus sp. NSJ-71]|jgi:predicted phage tail component-like protein|uniref:Phage tail family protein n=1 Tax=Ruminococcus intestinalis TaxID=2763066 RepID=A0ABR7HKT3_9FIRM|nr:distal tail protein Dit [Ruminococcus intestinalis]MBC5728144.1 phage tail family protein [Ruminococcus intestinalis]